MEELIEKVDILKKSLNQEDIVQEIKELNNKVKTDKQLLSLIENYRTTKDENIKKQILENSLFREYKEKETEINILILEINKRLKEITKKDKCLDESN